MEAVSGFFVAYRTDGVVRCVERIFSLVDIIHNGGHAHRQSVLADDHSVHSVRHHVAGAHLAGDRIAILRHILEAASGRMIRPALADIMGEQETSAAGSAVVDRATFLAGVDCLSHEV